MKRLVLAAAALTLIGSVQAQETLFDLEKIYERQLNLFKNLFLGLHEPPRYI